MSSRATSAGIDPAAIMQIKNLTLRAKTIVEGFAAGLHRSPARGFSVEFAEYRPYVLGDDPRNLDWKLMARTDRYYVKQYEDETNRRCYLAVDQSRSMAYASGAVSKQQYAQTLAATLAYFLTLQRDAVGVMCCGMEKVEQGEDTTRRAVRQGEDTTRRAVRQEEDTTRRVVRQKGERREASTFLPPRHRPGHLQQIMRMLERDSAGRDSDLSADLAQLASLSRRRGLVVLISDLLTDPESLYQPLGYLRGRGHHILVQRILDRRELDLQLDSSAVLRDMETGQEMFVDPQAARRDYLRRFETHQQQLVDICHRRGARMLTATTDQPLDITLLNLIHASSGGSK